MTDVDNVNSNYHNNSSGVARLKPPYDRPLDTYSLHFVPLRPYVYIA